MASEFSEEELKLGWTGRQIISCPRAAAEITGYVDCYMGVVTTECVLDYPRLPSPAPEILEYLVRQPGAQGTIEDILQWWVLDSCIRKWASKITEVVAQLVERGFLEEKLSSDGKIFYRISPLYLSTLQQLAPRNSPPDATP